MYNRSLEERMPQPPDTVGCNSVPTLQDDIKDKWFPPSERDRCSRRLKGVFYREWAEGVGGRSKFPGKIELEKIKKKKKI